MEKVRNKNKSNRQSIMSKRCSIIKERKKDISKQIEIKERKKMDHSLEDNIIITLYNILK